VLLEDQDRDGWDVSEIDEGRVLVERALRMRHLGPYQLQAAIAAVHADARRSGEIDWDQIAGLYDELLRRRALAGDRAQPRRGDRAGGAGSRTGSP